MTDIKTTTPTPEPSKDWLAVQRIEKLKADKHHEEDIAKKNPIGLLMAGLCAYVRKTALFLASRPLAGQKSALARGVEHELTELKKALTLLSKEDISQSPEFALHLSKVWHHLLESVNLVEFLERKKSNVIAQLKTLIETFYAYPLKQEHSLGFYMTEFAGKDWLPFPFMELLHQLYEDHLTHQNESELAKWISAIDSILANLMKK
jgi:hypothetical protein